jgi:hypothetical protein
LNWRNKIPPTRDRGGSSFEVQVLQAFHLDKIQVEYQKPIVAANVDYLIQRRIPLCLDGPHHDSEPQRQRDLRTNAALLILRYSPIRVRYKPPVPQAMRDTFWPVFLETLQETWTEPRLIRFDLTAARPVREDVPRWEVVKEALQ